MSLECTSRSLRGFLLFLNHMSMYDFQFSLLLGSISSQWNTIIFNFNYSPFVLTYNAFILHNVRNKMFKYNVFFIFSLAMLQNNYHKE